MFFCLITIFNGHPKLPFQSTSLPTYKSNLWRKNQSIYRVALRPLFFPRPGTSYLSLSPSSPILPSSSRVGSRTSSNLISHLSIVLTYCLSISSTSLQIIVSLRFWKYRSRKSYCSHLISQPSSWIPLTSGLRAYPLNKSWMQICCYCYCWTQLYMCALSRSNYMFEFLDHLWFFVTMLV